jgi:uncharacterized protein
LKVEEERLAEVIARGKEKLFAEREKRIKPFRDEKVLTAWNGLMLAAFAEAAAVLDRDEYLDVARRNADFLLSELQTGQGDSSLLRTWKDGKAKLNAYIEDYANLADGLIELYKASGEIRYLVEAKRLADRMITEFWDDETGGFFFTSNDHEELIVRNKDFYDNATPSGNSVAADVLLRLAKYYGDQRYERFGSMVLRLVASQIKRYPQGFGRALSVAEFHLASVRELVVIGDLKNDLSREVLSGYLPTAIVSISEGANEDVALLKGRSMVDGKPTAYVCENFVCQRPVTAVEELRAQLGQATPNPN